MEPTKDMEISPDELIQNAVDTIRERLIDDDMRVRIQQTERKYVSSRTLTPNEDAKKLEQMIAADASVWPMRLYLADVYLQMGAHEQFEREVSDCLAKSNDPFVVVSLFMFMTRLFVMRAADLADAVRYVRETLENNPSVAPYIRSIYIQTLLEAGDFEETYDQLQVAIEERNPMLTMEGLEILPMLLARLGRWQDADGTAQRIVSFAKEELTEHEQFALVEDLIGDVRDREQLMDIQTARFLMKIATSIAPEHPAVLGYESIATQVPNFLPPIQ